jgi:hypothetical protein
VGDRWRVVELRAITDAEGRTVKAQSIDPGVFDVPLAAPRRRPPQPPPAIGPAQVRVLDLAAARSGAGVTFSWIRRKRGPMPASWDVTVPLGEDSESYEIDVLSGSTVVRTLHATTPSALYAAADETADFGGPQSSLAVRVYQMSATVGRGFPAAATLTP